ncbi:MAG TPA: hypothetical protein VFU22_23280, partial [Roseiflexaceae bacterium]|nr:hypothetical protein [Roseiflexaceae bacterium]
LVLLLLILVLLPIPWLGTLATRLQQILAGYLGDSYVLLISPVRAEAIVTRVRRDFEWLAAKCKTVAIVAHSQGAAVSYLMLQKGISSEFQSRQVLLCTFGSGLSKLESARAIQEQWTTGYWPILGFFIAALCSTFLFLRISTSTITSALVWIALAVSIGVIFVSLRRIYKSSKLPADDYAPLKRFGKETIWMDYYASRDPVPNGRLFDDTPDYFTKDNGRSTEVYNNAWFLTDHSTYWKNRDGFVGAITCAVGELAENLAPERFGRLRPLDAVRIELAMCRRRWRVGWLAWTRRVAAAAAAVLIFMRWDDLDEFGKFLRSEIDMVNQTPFSFTIAPLLPFYNYASLRITGILGVTVAVMIAYYTLRMVWKFWEVRDVRLFFLRSRYDLTGSAVFLLMGSGWLALAVGVALGWTPPLPKLELAQLVGDLVTAILLPPVIIGGVYMLSGIILSNIIEFARLLETIAELLVTFARRQAAWLISYAFHLRAACYNRQMAFDAILIRSYVFCLAVGALILWYQFASPAATSDVKGNVALLVAVMVCVVGWSKLPAWLRARGGVGHPATALEILASDAERDRVKALLEACRVVNSNDQSVREALEKVAKKPKATKYAGRPTVAGR